jgi:hypothetical protein
MYKAIHAPSDQEIIILDRRWAAQVDYLRDLDRKDALVCPGCRQPVRVRAGRFRRWHFAHKHLANCPYARESATLLAMRAVLYDWLVSRFGDDAVTIEVMPESVGFIRPVDCWVGTGEAAFATWLLDRRTPLDERQALAVGFQRLGIPVQVVFAATMLRPDPSPYQQRLHLTTTERAFLRTTPLDAAWQTHFEQLGGSLHYLDPEGGTLTTYRNLLVYHAPQLYTGTCLQHPLAEVQADPTSGAFIHPGELEQQRKHQAALSERQRKAQERLHKAEDFFAAKIEATPSLAYPQTPAEAHTPFRREATCRVCGRVTADWVQYDGASGTCLCRECQKRSD